MSRTHFLLFLLWTGFSITTPAASYYLSSSTGKDTYTPQEAQNPSTPWQSLDKLNQYIPSLAPGDSVLFKKGDVFYGALHLKKSGTRENPIVYSHYGKGPLPMITGLSELNGWVRHSPGIYYVELPSSSSPLRVLTLEGKPQAMGRFPNSDEINKGYLIPEKVIGENQLTHHVFQKNNQWKGAELVLRKNHWIIDRQKITAQQENTITFSSATGYTPKKGYGFFLQNHLETLDQLGEWYQDMENNRLYVCLENDNPEDHTIKASTIDQLITTLPNTRNVTIDGLHLNGANEVGLLIRGGSFFRFSNGIIENSGESGVMALNMDHLSILHSEIRDSFNSGIYLRSGNYQATISDNLIENTFMMPGMGQNGDNNGYALFSISDADTIVRNTLRNTGYVGIGFRGSNTLVQHNLVDGFCLNKGDGGGIYSYTGNSNPGYKARIITGNTVRNGDGAREGTPLQGTDLPAPAEGIYLDDNSNNVRVINNTIYKISNKAIYLHNAQNIEVSDNLVYDAGYLVFLADDELGQSLKNIRISNNTLIKKEPHQIGLGIRSGFPEFDDIGHTDQNQYLDFSGTGISFYLQNTESNEEKYYDSENWKKVSGWEHHASIRELRAYLENSASNYTSSAARTFSEATARERITCTMGCNLRWESEGGFSVAGNAEKSEMKVNLSGLENNAGYALSLSISDSENTVVEAFLRQNGPPYRKLSASKTLIPKKATQNFNLFFDSPKQQGAPALMLSFYQGNQTTRISEFIVTPLEQAQKSSLQANYKLLTNPTNREAIIQLDREWEDHEGRSYTGSLTMTPYKSLFLFRK